jgi:transglutaminase-like putative cysteine protease
MGSEARTRVALVALLLATLFSFAQVFDRGSWPGPALLGMILAALIVIGSRRAGIGTGWTVLVSTGALVWYCTLIFRMDDLFFGLPTLTALEGVGRAVRAAAEKSNLDYAPVPVRPGYVALTIAAMWVTTALAEIATFRWRRPLVAALPAIGLFSFVTVVGTRHGTTFLVLAFLSALLAFLALESAHRLRAWGSWVTSLADRRGETPGDVSSRLARRMGASCLAAALFAPIFLPAIGDGLLAWRNPTGSGPGSGFGSGGGEVDLLASLQPTILNQSTAAMMRVSSDIPEYWRLTSLVTFDGTTWRPLEGQALSPVAQDMVTSANPPEQGRVITQRFTIQGLRGEHMPMAVQPTSVRIVTDTDARGGVPLQYEFEMGTLELTTGLESGFVYEGTSLVPRPQSFRVMRDAALESDFHDLYTDTGPIPISPEVEQLLQRWTGEAETPFLKLVALQTNLRLFTYSEDVPARASTDHLTEFLTSTRRGYCQQFAAAFALLARHLGFPARVSVGFLPGGTTPAEPTKFNVEGTDAHAWPEVLFEDYGWVRFEPTPGNSASPPSYTSQIAPFSTRCPLQACNPFSDNPGGLGAGNPGLLEENQNVPTGGRDRGGPVLTGEGRRGIGRPDWEQTFSAVLTILLLAFLLFIASVPGLKSLRTWTLYRSARTPSAVAEAAFAHFEREAADLANSRARSETASGFARRMGAAHRVPRSNVLELAAIYERASYAREGIDPTAATRAKRLAASLRRELWTSADFAQRVKRLFSPAGLLER